MVGYIRWWDFMSLGRVWAFSYGLLGTYGRDPDTLVMDKKVRNLVLDNWRVTIRIR